MAADDCKMNMSRFYIKNNKVIENVAEIEKKEDINDFAHKITAGEEVDKHINSAFTGTYVKRKQVRDNIPESDPTHKKPNQGQEMDDDSHMTQETEREKRIKIFKLNSSRLLHERNKYVFLASVAEDAISLSLISKYNLSEMVGFLLIKKLFYMIGHLKTMLEDQQNTFKLAEWEEYVDTTDFSKIYVYISKEYDVFKVYYDSMHENVKKNSEKANFVNDLVSRALKATG